jgi:hypothetical protein
VPRIAVELRHGGLVGDEIPTIEMHGDLGVDLRQLLASGAQVAFQIHSRRLGLAPRRTDSVDVSP